ncbi:MAG: hypothetical protein JXR37_10020 [Kiritimatiellae bacterium]|nr:hypothetical protein [Kiritimatiellia bacterium]
MKMLMDLFLCAALGAVSVQAGAGDAVPQPDLKNALAAAPLVEPEQLGVVAKNIQCSSQRSFVPNPDGKTYDVLQWYYGEYEGPTWLYVIDLGAGESKKLRFPDNRQISMAGRAFGLDGKLYMATPYYYYGARHEAARLGIPTGMELHVYDPASNELENRGVIVPGLSGERRPLTRGPDGKLYGAGSYLKQGKVGLYSYDPATRKVREYGAVGPAHKGGVWTDWGLRVDETHIYTLSGFTPYYLVAVDIKTGADKVLLETQPGGTMRLRGGPSVEVAETRGAPLKKYWLNAGAAIPKTNDTRPWTRTEHPRPPRPPEPEMHWGEMIPDAEGRARLWYRPPRSDAAGAQAEPHEWKSIELQRVESYPLRVKLLAALPDGRIFCRAEGHHGGSLYDPRTGSVTASGVCGVEAYACLSHAGKVYWTGYSGGMTYVYDPSRPWNLRKSVPPGCKAVKRDSPESNPRHLASFDEDCRVSQMLSAVVGADNKLYMCGWGVRAYKGGAFCWIDLTTEEKGGLWRPFIGYRTYWLAAALDRRFIVVSTAATEDGLNNWQRPPDAKLFVYDTQAGKFVREIVPVTGSLKTGPILEVRPGRLLGIADDPDNKGGGILYALDIRSGKILFRKTLPYPPPVVTSHLNVQCGYELGPDGHIWTFLGRGGWAPETPDTLVRIGPDTGHVEPVCRLKQLGNFIFVGNDMYLAGTKQLRRMRGVAGTANER